MLQKEEGQVCVCVGGGHEPSLRWWLDSLACLKGCHAWERQSIDKVGRRRWRVWGREGGGGCFSHSNWGQKKTVYLFIFHVVPFCLVRPLQKIGLEARSAVENVFPIKPLHKPFSLDWKELKGGVTLVNYGSLQSAKITVNCCHLQGALTHYGIFPS